MRFPILIEPTATGFSGHVPDLPGCVAAGETCEETVSLLREAIEFHLEGMRLQGEPAPTQTAIVEYVEVNTAVG
ncbi:MAG: type II toxin-antitoxin system HicB family antitoxin [Pirellulaceae bacterium]